MLSDGFRPAEVTIDGWPRAFPALLRVMPDGTPDTWNGWACPYFDRTAVDAIIQGWRSGVGWTAEVYRAEWRGVVARFYDPTDDTWEEVSPVDVDGEPRWPVGAERWCWYETETEEARA